MAFKLLALFLILWTVFNILVSFHGIFACRAIASFLGAISGSFLVFFSLFLVFELVLATGSSGTRKKSKLNTVQFSSSTKVDRKGCEDENPYSFFHKIHLSIYYKQKRSLRSCHLWMWTPQVKDRGEKFSRDDWLKYTTYAVV